ncbi:MAG TPA: DUF11 domain-containing protein, partial [Thermoanaerobaculia bacterium]|nr:DUF11 domain-containing protein [Thermoanaerobaculia bacterium]
FTYDPRGSATLQALRQGQNVTDTFGYVAEDQTNHSASGTVSINVTGVNATLVLSKTLLAPAVPHVNHQATYRLSLTNQGPGPATHVMVTDPLPSEVSFASSSCASSSSGTVTWTVGTLAYNGSINCDVVVNVLKQGTIVNTATVAADDTDPKLDQTTATARFTAIAQAATEIPTESGLGLVLLALGLAIAGVWLAASVRLTR